jgi:hypothetical protein
LRTAGLIGLAVLATGCVDLPEKTQDLLEVFIVVVSVCIVLNLVLILLIVFYFLPFTRPKRRKRK